jgi:hypothetical protein
MKWGVRQYQNPDGSLTAAGKARYRGASIRSKVQLGRSYFSAKRGATNYYKRKDDVFGKEAKNSRESQKYSSKQILGDIANDDLRTYLKSNADYARMEASDANARPKSYDRYSRVYKRKMDDRVVPNERRKYRKRVDRWIQNEFADSSIQTIKGFKGNELKNAGKAYVYQALKEMEAESRQRAQEAKAARKKEFDYAVGRAKKYANRAKEVVTKPFKRNNQNEKE